MELYCSVLAASRSLLRIPAPRAVLPGRVPPRPYSDPLGSSYATWSAADVVSLSYGGTLASTPGAAAVLPASPGLEPILSVVSASEPLSLVADMWAFQTLGSVWGTALGHGVPLNPGAGASWMLPRTWAPDSAAAYFQNSVPAVGGLNGAGVAVLGAPGAPAPGFGPAVPTGIAFVASALSWSVVGVPAPGRPVIAGAPTDVHALLYATPGNASLLLPPFTLRASYTYNVTVAANLTAQWSFLPADVLPLWAPLAGAPAPVLSPLSLPIAYNPYDAAVGVALPSAYSPALLVHSPPFNGTLSALTGPPPSSEGPALAAVFAVATSGWVDVDASVLRPAQTLGSTSAGNASLLGLLAALPLPPPIVTALLLEAPLGSDASLSSAAFSACSTAQPAPAWWRAFVLLVVPLGLSPASACGAVSYAAQGGELAPSPNAPLTFSFGAVPGALSAYRLPGAAVPGTGLALSWAASTALQANASSILSNPPGVALALPTTSQTISSNLVIPGPLWGPVAVAVLVGDVYGAAGAAFAQAVLVAPSTAVLANPDAIVALLEPVAASISSSAAIASNPMGTLATAGACAELLSTAAALVASGTPSQLTLSAALDLQASLLDSIFVAVAALDATAAAAAAALPTDSSALNAALVLVASSAQGAAAPPLSDALLSVTVNSLLALAALPLPSASDAQLAALSAASGALTLALPVSAGPTTPVSAGTVAAFLGVFSGVVASTNASAATTGVMSSVGLDPASLLQLDASLSTLAAVTLRDSPPGAPPTLVVSAGLPPAALLRNSTALSYCAPGVISTVASVQLPASGFPPSRSFVLAPGQSFGSCFTSAVSLPVSAVTGQPPPSVAISPAGLSALGTAAEGSRVSVQVTQWGWSPEPANPANFAALSYPALKSNRAAALSSGSSAASRRLGVVEAAIPRELGFVASLVSAFSPSSSLASSAVDVTTAAVAELIPLPTRASDVNPAHPLDSRVVSVRVTSASGQRVAAGVFSNAPLNVTIPLLDLSIVAWDSATNQSTGVNIGQAARAGPVINVTCPTSLAAANSGIAAVYATSTALGRVGSPARATLINVTQLSFDAPLNDVSTLSATLANAQVAVGGSVLASGSNYTSNATARTDVLAYTIAADCGPTFGNVSLLCGPGSGGSVVTFVCPTVMPVAACLWFDVASNQWSNNGCSVVAVHPTYVTCSCTLAADFAVRFASLPVLGNDVFATNKPSVIYRTVPPSIALLAVVAVMFAALVLGSFVGAVQDAFAARTFVAELSKDSEVAVALHCSAARAAAAGGDPQALDALAPIAKAALPKGRSSKRQGKVAPEPPARGVPPPAVELRSARSVRSVSPAARPSLVSDAVDRGGTAAAVPRNSAASPLQHAPPAQWSHNAFTTALWLRVQQLLEHLCVAPVPVWRSLEGADATRAVGFSPSLASASAASLLVDFDAALRAALRATGGDTPAPPEVAVLKGLPFVALPPPPPAATPQRPPQHREPRSSLPSGSFALSVPMSPASHAAEAAVASLTRGNPALTERVRRARAALCIPPVLSALEVAPDGAAEGLDRDTPSEADNGSPEDDDEDSVPTQTLPPPPHPLPPHPRETCFARSRRLLPTSSRVAGVRAFWQHPLVSPAALYDPASPRALRWALSSASAFFTLFMAAYLYTNYFGVREPGPSGWLPLLPLSVLGLLCVAVSAGVTSGLASAVIAAPARWAGSAEFTWRHPVLALELRRRVAAERVLREVPTRVLLEQLKVKVGASAHPADSAADPALPSPAAAASSTADQAAALYRVGPLELAFEEACWEEERRAAAPLYRACCRGGAADHDSYSAEEQGAPDGGMDVRRAPSCLRMPCSPALALGLLVAWVAVLWAVAYLLLFAVSRGTAACVSLLYAWAIAHSVVLFIANPLAVQARTAWHFVVLPVAAAALGPALRDASGEHGCNACCARVSGAAAARDARVGGAPAGVLSARLRLVAVPRAAAAAAGLPADAAAAVFCDLPALAAVLDGDAYAVGASVPPPGAPESALRAAVLVRRYLLLALGLSPAALRQFCAVPPAAPVPRASGVADPRSQRPTSASSSDSDAALPLSAGRSHRPSLIINSSHRAPVVLPGLQVPDGLTDVYKKVARERPLSASNDEDVVPHPPASALELARANARSVLVRGGRLPPSAFVGAGGLVLHRAQAVQAAGGVSLAPLLPSLDRARQRAQLVLAQPAAAAPSLPRGLRSALDSARSTGPAAVARVILNQGVSPSIAARALVDAAARQHQAAASRLRTAVSEPPGTAHRRYDADTQDTPAL